MAARRVVVVLAVALILSVSCSGNDPIVFPQAAGDQGLAADYVERPVIVLDFAEFVFNVTLFNWDDLGLLDVSYAYDAGTATWTKVDSTFQTVTVGSPGKPSTEVRRVSVAALEVKFLDSLGVAQEDLITARRAEMMVRIHQFRYALDPDYVLDEDYDVTAKFSASFALDAGSADTVVADGTLEGWWGRPDDTEHPRVDYEGTAGIEFDFPGHYVHCPAQRLSADIRVLEGGVELDRFTGSFSAQADEVDYDGTLDSEKGPAAIGVHLTRSCPATSRTPPTPIEVMFSRAGR